SPHNPLINSSRGPILDPRAHSESPNREPIGVSRPAAAPGGGPGPRPDRRVAGPEPLRARRGPAPPQHHRHPPHGDRMPRTGGPPRSGHPALGAGARPRLLSGGVPQARPRAIRARDPPGPLRGRRTTGTRPGVAARLAQVPRSRLAAARDRQPVVG